MIGRGVGILSGNLSCVEYTTEVMLRVEICRNYESRGDSSDNYLLS